MNGAGDRTKPRRLIHQRALPNKPCIFRSAIFGLGSAFGREEIGERGFCRIMICAMAAEIETKESPKREVRAAAGATELAVTGMTCGNCARHVTEALQSVAGVHSANVSLDSKRALVRWSAGSIHNAPGLLEALERAGYEAEIVEAGHAHGGGERKLAGWEYNLWIGVLGTAPLMLGEWAFGLGTERWFRWLSFAIAAVVQVFAGAQFYRGAWKQLKSGSSNMDTLVALGSTTAFAYSVWALLSGAAGHLYFMESASIITLISLGHWLESRVGVRASSALRQLLTLAPERARQVGPDGAEKEVPVSELRPGDRVALRPGEKIPADGEVVDGASAVNESMLTGESVPVDKSASAPVYAGTVNLNGRLVIRVLATGEETALAHVIAAVQRAQTSRANIQRLGDKVSSVFVPIVVAIAVLAGLWWGLAPDSAHRVHDALAHFLWPAHPPTGAAAGFIVAAAILIVACPCAMGLATPAAIMAGANAAARRGILIRDGVALEKAGSITAVLFDKTGTLTLGRPAVSAIWTAQTGREGKAGHQPSPADADSQDLQLAASLARHSSHPLSQTIAQLSKSEMKFGKWNELPGSGIEASFSGPTSTNIRLGSLRWLESTGVELSAGKAFMENWSAQGATLVGLSRERSLLALFALRDPIKPGARQVIAELRRHGRKAYLVTGDNQLTAAAIGHQLGIPVENVFAQVRPEQKAELVKQVRARGERVAFVGDGINDAPALEQADLGIAVSRASDIAREAADIILLRSEIEAVPESLELAAATLRTIKQNLFWAFFYNAAAIPLAALAFMSPILCAAAMGLSDFVVLGNAVRLLVWRSRSIDPHGGKQPQH